MTDNTIFPKDSVDKLSTAYARIAELEAALEESRRDAGQAENQRRELACLLEDVVIGIQTVAPDGVIRWANRAALEMLGYTYEEVLGHPIVKFHTDQEAAVDFLEHMRHSRVPVRQEFHLLCKDGSGKHLRIDCKPVWKEDRLDHFRFFSQEITQNKQEEEDLRRARDELEAQVRQRTAELTDAIVALSQEVDERMRIESLIRESENQLATAQEIAHIGSWVWEIAANTVSWSDELYRIYGLPPQTPKVTYESFLARVVPEDREKVDSIISQALQDHKPFLFEHHILRPDGSVRTLLARGEIILDAAGQPIRMIGTGQDISDQRQAEEVLGRYGARLRVLHRIDRSILAARSVAEIAQAVVQHLRQFIPYFRGTVVVFDWKVQEARVLAVDTDRETRKKAGERIPLSIYGLSEELLEGKIHVVEDVLEDTQASPRVRELQAEGLRSYVSIPLMAQERLIGSLNLGSDRPGAFTPEDLAIAGELAGQLAIALQNAQLFEEVTESRKRLQILSRQLVEAQERERQFIAQELHDEAGQALTSLMIHFRLLQQEIGYAPEIVSRIEDMKGQTVAILDNLHRLARNLRPPSLDNLGLIPALRQYIETFSKQHNLEAQFETVNIDTERLPPEIEISLYRIIQEALNNVARHAHASRVGIGLERRADQVVTFIEDDGNGFDPEEALQRGRLGLLGMRERIESLGGNLEIESQPGLGTTIFIELPHNFLRPASRS